MKRLIFEDEHEALRETARQFIEKECVPNAEKWESRAPRRPRRPTSPQASTASSGSTCPRSSAAVASTTSGSTRSSTRRSPSYGVPAPALSLQNDVVGPYFKNLANDEQQERWLPGIISGELISAVAMTEPGAGSDLAGIRTSAVRDGDDWILNGSKTFISSGINCDLVVVVARTDPEAGHKGFSLLVVERGMEGFTRGRKLDKMGLHAPDTAELHFENVRVPDANVLGKEGAGFYHLMTNLPSERLSIAISAIAGARATFAETLQYVKDRKAFGQPIGSFQHNRFLLAEMDTELEIAEQYIDRCLQAVVDGELTAVEASKAKWWCTETAQEGRRPLRAAARRLRLHERVPGRARLRRRPHPDDLRWHHRDHEGDHRPRPRPLAGSPTRLGTPVADRAPKSVSRWAQPSARRGAGVGASADVGGAGRRCSGLPSCRRSDVVGGDRLRRRVRVQHRVDDVDPGVGGLDAAADHLGGVVDLDVAVLAVDLDLGALLGGPLALRRRRGRAGRGTRGSSPAWSARRDRPSAPRAARDRAWRTRRWSARTPRTGRSRAPGTS